VASALYFFGKIDSTAGTSAGPACGKVARLGLDDRDRAFVKWQVRWHTERQPEIDVAVELCLHSLVRGMSSPTLDVVRSSGIGRISALLFGATDPSHV
jgi:hypothetical protein